MKKLFVSLLVLSILVTSCNALDLANDIPWESLSMDDLIGIREKATLEIISKGGWQDVTIGAGIYQIGKDIPAGKWEIRAVTPALLCVGDIVAENKNEIQYTGNYFYYTLSRGDTASVELTDGYYLTTNAKINFTPYIGLNFNFDK